MSEDINTEETTPSTPSITPNLILKLGGETVATSTETIKANNQWEACYNTNYVYVNSNAADNSDKTQFFIDPNNTKILLGKAKLKSLSWENPTQKYYNVYVKTALQEVINPTVEEEPPVIYPTKNVTALGQGKGIDLSYETNDDIQSIIISVDDSVITKTNFDQALEQSYSLNKKILTSMQEYELRNLLQFLTVEYGDDIDDENKLTLGDSNKSPNDIFAFSFQYRASSIIQGKKFNCLKIKKQTNTQPIYCIIRQCYYDNLDDFQTKFGSLPLFSDNQSEEITMDKFELLYTNSKPIVMSLNGISANDKTEKSEWYFPNDFEIKQDSIYLITFQNDKSPQMTSENTRLINVGGDDDVRSLSTFIRRYNRSFSQSSSYGNDESWYIIDAEFCRKQPIGVKFK